MMGFEWELGGIKDERGVRELAMVRRFVQRESKPDTCRRVWGPWEERRDEEGVFRVRRCSEENCNSMHFDFPAVSYGI